MRRTRQEDLREEWKRGKRKEKRELRQVIHVDVNYEMKTTAGKERD